MSEIKVSKKLLTMCQNCRENNGKYRTEDMSFLCDSCYNGIDYELRNRNIKLREKGV